MFPYYGAKTNVVKYYPPPIHDKIIEPFAGSARYSLRYFEKDVLLVDKYKVLVDLWKWLQQCSPADILKLPKVKQGESLDSFEFDCQEAKTLMGFMMGFSAESPRNTGTIKLTQRPNYINYNLKRIARDLFKIKHWQIRHGTYEDIPNQKGTYFIDPPYQVAGDSYIESGKNINFQCLKEWSVSREGQVIICESNKADWMEFAPLKSHRTRNGMTSEVMWTNTPDHLKNYQLQIFK